VRRGGEEVLLDVGGQDATEAFEDVGHSDEAREILEGLLVGKLKRQVHPHSALSPTSFHIPHSTFHIPHSTFHIPHSTFHIPHSTFHIPHSTFHIPRAHSPFPLPEPPRF